MQWGVASNEDEKMDARELIDQLKTVFVSVEGADVVVRLQDILDIESPENETEFRTIASDLAWELRSERAVSNFNSRLSILEDVSFANEGEPVLRAQELLWYVLAQYYRFDFRYERLALLEARVLAVLTRGDPLHEVLQLYARVGEGDARSLDAAKDLVERIPDATSNYRLGYDWRVRQVVLHALELFESPDIESSDDEVKIREASIELAEWSLEHDTDIQHTNTHFRLARAHRKLGNISQARTHIRRCLQTTIMDNQAHADYVREREHITQTASIQRIVLQAERKMQEQADSHANSVSTHFKAVSEEDADTRREFEDQIRSQMREGLFATVEILAVLTFVIAFIFQAGAVSVRTVDEVWEGALLLITSALLIVGILRLVGRQVLTTTGAKTDQGKD